MDLISLFSQLLSPFEFTSSNFLIKKKNILISAVLAIIETSRIDNPLSRHIYTTNLACVIRQILSFYTMKLQ